MPFRVIVDNAMRIVFTVRSTQQRSVQVKSFPLHEHLWVEFLALQYYTDRQFRTAHAQNTQQYT